MAENKKEDLDKLEKKIESLFAKCKVPERDAEHRIYDILLRGLHELSLRDFIQFIARIMQTMCLLTIGPQKNNPVRETKNE